MEKVTTKIVNKSLKIIGQFILLVFIILILISIMPPLLIIIFGPNIHVGLMYGIIFVFVVLVFLKVRDITVRLWTIAGLVLITVALMIWSEFWIARYFYQHREKNEAPQATGLK